MKKTKSTLASLKGMPSGTTPPTTSSITDLMHDPNSSVGSPPPPLTLPSSYYKNSDYLHLVRPTASGPGGSTGGGPSSGFSPYFNPVSGVAGMASSSPKYATPPLPSDSLLGSPIPDYRHDTPAQKYYYDQGMPPSSGHPPPTGVPPSAGPQVAPSTTSAAHPLSLTSVSPTSGVIFN